MSSEPRFVEPIVIAVGGALWSTNVGAGTDPPAWDNGTPYAANARVTAGNYIYQAVQANTGKDPTTDDTDTWWVQASAINKLCMFDRKVGSQTQNPDTIEVVIKPGMQVVDVIALRNVEAQSVRVQQATDADGVVFDRTVRLDAPISDWYDYFFGPMIYGSDAAFSDLKPYTDATYTITVDNTGGTAKCGELLMGVALKTGITEVGVQMGIDDYSLVKPNDFGVYDIVQRDFADNMELTIYVNALWSPTLKRLLTRNRAQPILLLAADSRPDAQVYGLAESWRQILSYPGTDVFTITMKGLT